MTAGKSFQPNDCGRSLNDVEAIAVHAVRAVALALALAVVYAPPAIAQPAPPKPDSLDAVQQIVDEARRDSKAYDVSGAAAGAEHPAIKWDRVLWEIHGRAPGTPAGALAAVEAVRLLTQAKLWQQADARIETLTVDDAAWERLPSVIYTAGIERNDLPSVISRLSRVSASTTKSSIKGAALVIIGRAYRRQGDSAAATRALEDAKAAAPDTPYAEEASGVIYEIAHLSAGMTAPAISAKARNGRTVSLSALRGKPVVLVFWGTT